jgi:phage antirepressor YoqD-like protein
MIHQNDFINWLLNRGYIYRDAKKSIRPHAKYTPDLFEIKEKKNGKWAGIQTRITPKGRETFRLLLKKQK